MRYWQAIKNIWKRNVFLLIMTCGLLLVTSGYWLGIPVYVVGDWLYELDFPNYIRIYVVLFCLCVLISIYFIPFHIEVAREMGGSLWRQLWQIEWRFVFGLFVSSLLFFFLLVWRAT